MRFAAVLLIAAATGFVDVPKGSGVRVIDGDTFELGGEVFRLLDIDAPETGRAKCEGEYRAGIKARDYLAYLFAYQARLARFPVDKYDRTLVKVEIWIAGQWFDVSHMMIESGDAVPYDGGKRRDWCKGR